MTATIYPAPTSALIISSPNPSGLTSNVTFNGLIDATTTILVGSPTGSLLFYTNGVTMKSVALGASGVGDSAATTSTTTLPAGSITVGAYYAGDGNYSSSTNWLTQTVTNSTPCSQTNRIVGWTYNGGNSVTLTNIGTTNAVYYVVSQTDVSQPLASWTPVVGSTNTNTTGIWTITLVNPSPIFYRVKAINACQ